MPQSQGTQALCWGVLAEQRRWKGKLQTDCRVRRQGGIREGGCGTGERKRKHFARCPIGRHEHRGVERRKLYRKPARNAP